jgi:hypothetical protein
VPSVFPEGTPNFPEVRERAARMAQAGFTGIWIAGREPNAVPRLPGCAIAYARDTDVLLRKAGTAQPAISTPASGP